MSHQPDRFTYIWSIHVADQRMSDLIITTISIEIIVSVTHSHHIRMSPFIIIIKHHHHHRRHRSSIRHGSYSSIPHPWLIMYNLSCSTYHPSLPVRHTSRGLCRRSAVIYHPSSVISDRQHQHLCTTIVIAIIYL